MKVPIIESFIEHYKYLQKTLDFYKTLRNMARQRKIEISSLSDSIVLHQYVNVNDQDVLDLYKAIEKFCDKQYEKFENELLSMEKKLDV